MEAIACRGGFKYFDGFRNLRFLNYDYQILYNNLEDSVSGRLQKLGKKWK